MLRSALKLLSMLQVGGRVRQFFDRLLRQALLVAVAVAFIVAAAAFAVLAAYRELLTIYPPTETALLMALALLLLGLLALGALQLIAPKRETTRDVISPAEGRNPIGATMSQIGPFPLVLIAFAGGVLAGRR
jgi:hypothetical protein